MVPKGWEVKKLNELCEINPKKPSKPSDELVSFISMSQISEEGQIISTEPKTYDEVSKGFTSFKDKDVLVAKITPCFENGKGALAHSLVNGIGFGSTEFHVLRAKKITDPKFIYYLTRTNAFRAKGTMNMQGSAGHRRVTTDFIKVYKINTPPLPEQQKIAKILSTWDKAISTTERLIDNSTQQKKALMQQLLTGKKRLLDESGRRFEGEWVKGLVSDLADTVMGYAFKSNDFVKEGIPLVRMGNLYQNQFQLDRSPIYLPNDFATEYKKFLLQSGDLVMSMTGTMGKRDYGFAVEIPENTQDCLLNQRVLKIEPRNSDAKGFVLNVLKSEVFLSKLYSLPGGTKQANLSATQIREISVLIPPLPEQQKIATVLTNADQEIELLEQQLAGLQQEKKALLQVLLTGKKRVVVDGEIA